MPKDRQKGTDNSTELRSTAFPLNASTDPTSSGYADKMRGAAFSVFTLEEEGIEALTLRPSRAGLATAENLPKPVDFTSLPATSRAVISSIVACTAGFARPASSPVPSATRPANPSSVVTDIVVS
jgi:hypothetical protein